LSAGMRLLATNCFMARALRASTAPAFSPWLVLGAWSEPASSILANRLHLRYSCTQDYASNLEGNRHHCFHMQLVYSSFFFQCIECLIVSVGSFFFNFARNFILIRCSIFIPVISLAEQHSTVTLKQAQRQTNWYRHTSLRVVRFWKLQGWCECSQSRYLTATPRTEWTLAIL
jgi:hypothetical protein